MNIHVSSKQLCKTEIHVHLESEGTDEYGQPEKVLDLDLLGNFQDGAKTVWTDEKKLVQITGTALFPGDIAPDWPSLSGGTVRCSVKYVGQSGNKLGIRTGRSIIAGWR